MLYKRLLQKISCIFFIATLVACGSDTADDPNNSQQGSSSSNSSSSSGGNSSSSSSSSTSSSSTSSSSSASSSSSSGEPVEYEAFISDRVVNEEFSMAALLDFDVASYESSNPAVATVANDGIVSILSEGNAVITAHATNNFKSSAENYFKTGVEITQTGAQIEINSIPSTFGVTAWVGENNTEFYFDQSVTGLDFFSSRDSECDFFNYFSCLMGQYHVVGQTTIIDTATTLSNAGYYFYNYGLNRTGNSYLSSARFAERSNEAVAVFKDKMWVIGGNINNDFTSLADIWSSTDGNVWVRETEQAPFGARIGANLISLNNKLWIVNGLSSTQQTNYTDLWSTTNGRDWVRESSSINLPERYAALSASFNGKMFVAGGWSYARDNWLYDMWYSDDGISWVQVPQENVPAFETNHASLLAQGNKLWLFGDKVWSSTDGINWIVEVETSPFADFENFHSVYHADQFWIFTYTFDNNYGNLSRVFTSSNGVDWNSPYGGVVIGNVRARESNLLAFKNRIFMLGGRNDILAYSNEVLSSADGKNWLNHGLGGLYAPRAGHSLTEHNGRLWSIGGMDDDTLYSDVWVSDDGVKWELVTAEANFPKRHGHQTLSFNNKLWLIAGSALLGNFGISFGDIFIQSTDVHTVSEDVWMSEDGINWTEVTPQSESSPNVIFENIEYTSAIVFNDRLWIVAAKLKSASNPLSHFLWSSADGETWRLHSPVGGGYSARTGHALAVHNGYLYLSGGKDGNGEYQSDVWRSADGDNWTLVTADFGADNRAYHQMLSKDGKLFILAGRANYHETLTFEDTTVSEYNDIWVSEDDGVTWTQITENAPFEQRRDHRAVVFNDEIIMTGGKGAAGYVFLLGKSSYLQDIWKSQDAINWRTGFYSELKLHQQ